MKGELVVLKLGGSLITGKSADEARVNGVVLKRIAREVAQALKAGSLRLVIVHGAGPFGHVPAKKYALNEGFKDAKQARGWAITHASMEKLNAAVVSALNEAGVDAIAFQPSAGGLLDDGRLVEFNVGAVAGLIGRGLVPVGFGDVLFDRTRGCSILSGDQLVPYLAKRLGASRVVVATDYNGIFDGDPKGGKARKIDVITRKNVGMLDGRRTSGTDVTGGIKRKVEEMLELAKEGIHTEIISGLERGYVKRALMGEEGLGTVVRLR